MNTILKNDLLKSEKLRNGILAVLMLFVFSFQGSAQWNALNIIPKPVHAETHQGVFTIHKTTLLQLDKSVQQFHPEGLNRQLQQLAGFTLKLSRTEKFTAKNIQLRINPLQVKQAEGYILVVKPDGIELTGADSSGLFYGLQTLSQLIRQSKKSVITIPACNIEDYPRFAYRGMHLDVGRNLFSIKSIKKWLDVLAFYKINTFHWHLTDDQGWRIEIKKFPKLQSISAWRKETLIGHKRAEPHLFDGKKYGGYYTQEEIKDLVNYAQQRQITVIPEIEIPGHAQAVLAAYPNLGCTGGPYETATFWGVFEDVFCAGNDETFDFMEAVLDEVIPLFPAPYIHIGGDECPKTRWKACPKCQARIQKEGLKDEHELQTYFMGRIEKYLSARGKKIIGWDEILEGGLTPDATVMSWRGIEGGIAAAKLKHQVIMTPEKYVYLDYYQSLNPAEQIAAGGYTPLKKLYNYEPLPEALSAEEKKYIKGVQANVWSEYLSDDEKAEYMMFPRIIALAEMAWSSKENRNYSDFLLRLDQHQKYLKPVNAFKAYYEITATNGTDFPGLELHTDQPKATIRYTLDGSKPSLKSKVYQKTIVPKKTCWVQAIAFVDGKAISPLYRQKLVSSLALGKMVHLKNQPQGNYAAHPQAMVNGIEGGKLYNNGEWLGFSGNNLEAVVDLGKTQTISALGINILKYHWQKMWAPKSLVFEISEDGEQYSTVYTQTEFPLEGINTVYHKFKALTGRYVKITGINTGTIPNGAYGAGGNAWLLADEIIIR